MFCCRCSQCCICSSTALVPDWRGSVCAYGTAHKPAFSLSISHLLLPPYGCIASVAYVVPFRAARSAGGTVVQKAEARCICLRYDKQVRYVGGRSVGALTRRRTWPSVICLGAAFRAASQRAGCLRHTVHLGSFAVCSSTALVAGWGWGRMGLILVYFVVYRVKYFPFCCTFWAFTAQAHL